MKSIFCSRTLKSVKKSAREYTHYKHSSCLLDETTIQEIKAMTGYIFSREDFFDFQKLAFIGMLISGAINFEKRKSQYGIQDKYRIIGLLKVKDRIKKWHEEEFGNLVELPKTFHA